MRNIHLATAIGAVAVLSIAATSHGAIAYALTDENSILTFDTAAPTQLINGAPLRTAGNAAIQDLIGIDIRPANNQLYGVGRLGTIYTIDPTTGIATPGATLTADGTDTSSPFTFLSGSRFGVDFNPVPDRLRITSNADQNLRINVATGATITDGALNPASVNVTASAYTNSVAGATTTQLYAIDPVTNNLHLQNPPNDGTQVVIGALGVDVSSVNGFDILSVGGQQAFAAFQLASGGVSELYTINLATGAATLVGTIGGGDLIDGLAVAIPEPATLGLIGGAAVLMLRRRGR